MILYVPMAGETFITVLKILFRQTQSLEFRGELQHASHTSGKLQCTKKLQIRDSHYTLRLDDSRSPTICLVKSEVVARGPLLFLRKLLFDRALFLKGPHP